jgi:hypothetical protein
MDLRHPAALALIVSSSLGAQAIADLGTATPIQGNWTYVPTADGSEARFTDTSANTQLIIHCTRATRRVSISKPAATAAPNMSIWTSSERRDVPSSFNPATAHLQIALQASDTLLDAISTSRGRIGITVGTQPALVVPAWPELARVVEDCRA